MEIVFAILKSPVYVVAIGYFLLQLEYYQAVGHPALEMLRKNLSNFVGEDIELANRYLGQSTQGRRGRSDSDSLDRSYRMLGVFMPVTSSVRPLIVQTHSLTGWSQNKRLEYKASDPVMMNAVTWMTELIDSFEDGSFTHYVTTPEEDRPRPGRPKGSKNGVKKRKEYYATKQAKRNVQKQSVEVQTQTLQSVPCILTANWLDYFTYHVTGSLNRKWYVGRGIDPTSLDDYEALKDYLFTEV